MMKLSGTLWACLLLASVSRADTYKAESGDSIERIARKLGTTSQKIKDLNPGLTDDKLKVGMSVHIPGNSSTGKVKISTNGQYWVRNGDTFKSIAHLYGISEGELKKLNDGQKIHTGMCINVPFKDASAKELRAAAVRMKSQTPVAGGVHVVAKGDNDWTIAAKYHTSAHQLRELNPNLDFEHLQIGASIRVPAPAKVAAVIPAPKAEPKKTEKKPELVKDAPAKVDPPVTDVPPATNPVTEPDENPLLETPISLAQKGKGTFQLSEPVRPSTEKKGSISTRAAKVKGSDVNMRSRPSTSADRVRQVDQGTVGKVLDEQNGWYKLQLSNGDKGWIRADFLAPTSETPVVASHAARLPKVSGKSGGSSSDIALLRSAYTYLGVRYVYGGTSRSGIDCSGFTGAVFRSQGINLPRTASEQSGMGHYVSRGELQRGDLIFFRTGRSSRINHVGLYIGGGRFIHASSGGGSVRTEELNKAYYTSHYATARRIRNFDKSANFKTEVSDDAVARDSGPLPDTEVAAAPIRQGADPIGK